MNELIFQVDQIPVDGTRGKVELEPSWFVLPLETIDPDHPIEITEPIAVDYMLQPSGKDIELRLKISTVATLECSRCLKSFPFPIAVSTKVFFYRGSSQESARVDVELTAHEIQSVSFQGSEIDISELVYEQIVISFPIKPLCHDACKGLCPRCGADRNVEDCSCELPRGDPRFEILQKLKIQR